MSARAKALMPVLAAFGLYVVYVGGYMMGERAALRHHANSLGAWLVLGSILFAIQVIVALWRAAGERDR